MMDGARMYFIAIVAPAEVNEQVLKWKQYMQDHFGCTVALRSPAHITLIPPFWMQQELEPALTNDLSAFAARQSSFTITLRNFDAFKPRVIFVHVEPHPALEELKKALEEFLLARNKYPIKKESRAFHPHVTIANRDLRKKDFIVAFDHFSKRAYQAEFSVRQLVLLQHTGTQWEVRHASAFENKNTNGII